MHALTCQSRYGHVCLCATPGVDADSAHEHASVLDGRDGSLGGPVRSPGLLAAPAAAAVGAATAAPASAADRPGIASCVRRTCSSGACVGAGSAAAGR